MEVETTTIETTNKSTNESTNDLKIRKSWKADNSPWPTNYCQIM